MEMLPPNEVQAETAPRDAHDHFTHGLSLVRRRTDREFDVGLRSIALGVHVLLDAMEAPWLAINSAAWGVERALYGRWGEPMPETVAEYNEWAPRMHAHSGPLRERREHDGLQVRETRLRMRVARLREHPPRLRDHRDSEPWFRGGRGLEPWRRAERRAIPTEWRNADEPELPEPRDIVEPVIEWSMLLHVLDAQSDDTAQETRIMTREEAAHTLDVDVDHNWSGCIPPDEFPYLLTHEIERAVVSWISYLAAVWNEGYAMESEGADLLGARVDVLDELCAEIERGASRRGAWSRTW